MRVVAVVPVVPHDKDIIRRDTLQPRQQRESLAKSDAVLEPAAPESNIPSSQKRNPLIDK